MSSYCHLYSPYDTIGVMVSASMSGDVGDATYEATCLVDVRILRCNCDSHKSVIAPLSMTSTSICDWNTNDAGSVMTLHVLDSMCSPSVWRWRSRDDPSRVRFYVFSLSMAVAVP